MNRKAGTRVYMLLVHEATKEEKKRWGTVDKDEGLWDYTDVRFDDSPKIVSPVLSYYLFTEQDECANSRWETTELKPGDDGYIDFFQ